MRKSLLTLCSVWLMGGLYTVPAHATSGSEDFVATSEVKLTLKTSLNFNNMEDVSVSGTVKDEHGEILPGVGITLKGTKVSTITDVLGKYKISVPETGGILVFTYIGFETRQVEINGRTLVDVRLVSDKKALEEVVVVGYGTVKKKDLTGSVAVVNVKDAKKTATYDVAKMLQGQVAGVTVQGSGEPGARVAIKIRGTTTFGSGSPLFVIDGVPVDNPSDFAPGEIESIQVLKDASAGAIYGARAATGVVIITTNKGKTGPLKINYNSYVGAQSIPKKIALTDRVGYQKITTAAEINAGRLVAPANDPANPKFSTTNTDWQDEMFKTAMMQDHSLSLSGGGEAVTFNASLGYFDQNSTLEGPAAYKRYTFNGGFQGKKGKFSFGGKTALSKANKNNLAGTNTHVVIGGGVTSMLTAMPTIPVLDPNRLGGYSGSDAGVNVGITLNVIGMNSLITDKSDRDRRLGNFWGEYELFKNLKYKINASYDNTDYNNYHFEPQFDMGFYYINPNYILSEERGNVNTALIENTLTYSLAISKHKVDFLAGTTYQEDHFGYIRGNATDNQELKFKTFSYISKTTAKTLSGGGDESRLLSYLARVNYNFDDRYLLTVNARRDGSSRFAPENKYGNFGSMAAAWNAHNESFIHLPSFISTLKVRGGYGVLGNQNFPGGPNYRYQSFINANASYVFNDALNAGATVVQLADPSIKWEQTATGNVAIDLGLFKDKLSFTAEYYTRKSTDLLANISLPLSVGVIPSSVTTNAATLENKGLEFNLTYKNNDHKLKYDISANLGTTKNKVLKLGGTNNPIYGAGSKTEVGGEIGQLFGHVVEGIFQNTDDVASHATQPGAAPGDIKFKDLNGDGKITDAGDRTYLGSAIPKFNGGLNIGASYQSFDFSMFIQGSYGNKVFNGVYRDLMTGQYNNHSVDELNFWTPTNTNTNIPRPVILDPNGNARFSDRFVDNGSYTRLQNAQIGYTLPKGVLTKAKAISNLRAYISGQNLFTVSKYRGYDPDFISDGLFSRGFDYGSFPNSRVIMLGLQIGL